MVTGASSRRRLVKHSVSVTLSRSPPQGAPTVCIECTKISAKTRMENLVAMSSKCVKINNFQRHEV